MTVPVISVLMPVRDAAPYLAQAIESVLNQTFSAFELLIVDDGSTDRSPSILKRYANRDRRIRLIRCPATGLAAALNEMLAQAQGEFIARMDADDIALPDRFEQQSHFLQQHPEVVCVGGWFHLIDHRGRFLTTLETASDDDTIQQAALAGHGSICHPASMIRRSALLQVGGYDASLVPAEDLDLWLRLGEVGQLANLPIPVLQYRLHSRSVSEQARVLQRQQARKACEQAWERRNIEGTFEAGYSWRPEPNRQSRHQFMLQYGWWAFSSGNRSTAGIYALKSIQLMPHRVEGWKLLVCALLKPTVPLAAQR